MIWFVPLAAIALLASGLALAYVIGGTTMMAFLATDNARHLAILPRKVFSQISVFALMAMPLFILAGELMNRGGVTRALIDVSMALVERLRGGLGHVNIMTSVCGAILTGLVLIAAAGWQVAARCLLDQPPVWTEQLARFSMVWVGVLGNFCAFRAMADPSPFPAMRDTPGRTGIVLAILRAKGAFAFIGPILWYSAFGPNGQLASGYAGRLMGRQAETMALPMAVFGIAIPIAFGLNLIHLLADLALRLTGQSRFAT